MTNKALSKALNTVRFACRLRIIARRLADAVGEEDEELGKALLQDDVLPTTTLARLSRAASFNSISHPRPGGGAQEAKTEKEMLTEVADNLQSNRVLSDLSALKDLVVENKVNVMLVCVPLGIAAGLAGWGAVPTFVLNFLALVPLALILGDVTEDLSLRLGTVAGGLLNATFGNVTEVVLSIAALEKGLFGVVANSLIGSILSNLLLVLGCCFIVGGYYYKTQTFNAASNRACSSLLFLSALGIVMPTAAAHLVTDPDARDDWVLLVSRCTAVVLLLCYVCYLVFSLKTHADIFDEEEEDNEEPELPVLSSTGAIVCLAVISALVAVHSEFLTGSIEEASKQTGVGTAFLSMIVLPIAGNACEHITAVMVAAKNKMDLSLGIAIGSSIQIALLAIPLVVVVGWCTGMAFSLDFEYFTVIALALSVVHANFVTSDASSHWLMGVQLIALYVVIGVVYFFR